MGCCRRSSKTTTLLQQASTKRGGRQVVPSQKPTLYKPDKQLATQSSSPIVSLLCKHFESKGGDILVDLTAQRKILFQASGSTFDLEENIELYGCTGKVPILVGLVRRNLDKLSTAPTSKQVKLGQLLATTIELLKKEA